MEYLAAPSLKYLCVIVQDGLKWEHHVGLLHRKLCNVFFALTVVNITKLLTSIQQKLTTMGFPVPSRVLLYFWANVLS